MMNIHPLCAGMMQISIFFKVAPFLGVLWAVNLGEPAWADFSCRSELVYKWRRAQQEKDVEVKHGIVEAFGATEELAKQALSLKLIPEQRKALLSCREEHENATGCVASKYASLGPTLERLDFAQRKNIQEAIATDCSQRQGTCGDVEAAPAQCVDRTPPTPQAEEGKKDAKKDDKGKKK